VLKGISPNVRLEQRSRADLLKEAASSHQE
jgi:hypothetical protein